MSKATVLRCDLCDQWDSQDNPVRSVGIGGPRFDLCSPCRVRKIVEMGVDPLNAAAYVEVFNGRTQTAGAHLSLSAALKVWKEKNAKGVSTSPDIETEDDEPEELDEKADPVDRVENDDVAADEAERRGLSVVDGGKVDHEPVTEPAPEEGGAETVKRPRRRGGAG